MNADTIHVHVARGTDAPAGAFPPSDVSCADAVDSIVDDCFFATGQVVGMRKSIDYDAVVWLRHHYRACFTRAIQRFGNRWSQDRDTVTSVALMLGERAVKHAGDRASLDVESVRKAADEVERYCQLHSRRAARARARAADRLADAEPPRVAGYWCLPDPTTTIDPGDGKDDGKGGGGGGDDVDAAGLHGLRRE